MQTVMSIEDAARELRKVYDRGATAFAAFATSEARTRGFADLRCGRGCAACCHQQIMVRAAEGAVIYEWAHARGRWTKELEARCAWADKHLARMTHPEVADARVPCVFLRQVETDGSLRGICTVYAARPLGCRAMFSAGAPGECLSSSSTLGVINVGPNAEFVRAAGGLMRAIDKAFEAERFAFTLPGAALYAAMRMSGRPSPDVFRVAIDERAIATTADEVAHGDEAAQEAAFARMLGEEVKPCG